MVFNFNSLILLILAGKLEFTSLTKNILLACTLVGMLGIVAFGARDAETIVGRIGGGLYSLLWNYFIYRRTLFHT